MNEAHLSTVVSSRRFEPCKVDLGSWWDTVMVHILSAIVVMKRKTGRWESARTEPSNSITLINAEAICRFKGRYFACVELGEVFFAHAALFGVDFYGESVHDLNVQVEVFGHEEDHC